MLPPRPALPGRGAFPGCGAQGLHNHPDSEVDAGCAKEAPVSQWATVMVALLLMATRPPELV